MKKLSAFILCMVVLLLAAAVVAPVAFAQGISGDKVVMGQNFTLGSGEVLDGNLIVLGGNATLEPDSLVQGEVTLLGGNLVIGGRVLSNVAIFGGSLQLTNTAVLEDNLVTIGGSVSRADGAQVHGQTFDELRTPNRIGPIAPAVPSLDLQQETPRGWFGQFINWQLGTVGSLLLMSLLGLVLVLIIPRHVGRVASAAAVQPGLALIFGLLTLVLGVLAGAILLIACGLGLLLWLVLVAAGILGWTGVGLFLGQRLLNAFKMRSSSSIAEVLVGVVLITFLSRLPCIGLLFWLVFACWGLGAVVMTRFGTQDAEGPAQSRPRPAAPLAPVTGPAASGGSGGDFTPLPEPSDLELANRPVVPPVAPVMPETPVISATELPPAALAVPEAAAPGALLTDITGIDATTADRLQVAGIRTVADLAASNPVEIASATGVPIGQIMTEDWIGQAQRLA